MGTEKELFAERFRSALQNLKKKMTHDFANQFNHGLTTPQFYILFMIRENGTCKVTALAEQMGVKPSAISVMIDKMVNQGYVIRLADTSDRRVVLLQITEAGLLVVKEFEQQSNEMIGKYFDKLSVDEIESMIKTFEKMNGTI
ncbi:MarR family transcriptional regulator [Paenibacillus psychroresistens]|uniref:MarR family transcriptional regulator n=1 Tax=Paenibacillus psychroresistens TaxID=1778678 RepID=A0A6B8RG39_9BACL|nr:MarR family transcriptional regulator [Paenibacillus psychroresistens]QGQ94545.1 MarR family transcriptional regulator [Paenibacillus psychroresistens]